MAPDMTGLRRVLAVLCSGIILLFSRVPASSAATSPDVFKNPVVTREERVFGLVTVYSTAKQHFGCFDKLPKLDWDKTFMEYLPLVEKDQSLYDYYRVLQRFSSILEDGHTNVYFPKSVQQELDTLPIRVDVVEGKWIVAGRVPTEEVMKEDIPKGSLLESIEGMPPDKYYADKFYPYIAAGREQAKRVQLASQASYPKDTKVSVVLRYPDGSSHQRVLKANRWTVKWTDDHVAKYALPWSYGPGFSSREPEPGILYIAFRSCDGASEKKLVDLLESRKLNWPKGVILDLRANPGGNTPMNCIRHLLSEPTKWYEALSRWSMSYMDAQTRGSSESDALEWLKNQGMPKQCTPGWYNMGWDKDTTTPASVHYSGPLAILAGPTTGSAAEDVVAVLQQAGRAKIIGDRTAGVTGQPLSFDLPGGGTGRVCTMKCRYTDGREFQGVGCEPDILVTPTIKGIEEGRDEVLDAALKYMRSAAE